MQKKTLLEEGRLFIAAEREKGVADEAIMRGLLDMGWNAKDIEAVLKEKPAAEHVPPPQLPPVTPPRSARELLRDIPGSWWATFAVTSAGLALLFSRSFTAFFDNIIFVVIFLVALLFAILIAAYVAMRKERLLKLVFALNAVYAGIVVFFLLAWITSFLLPAAIDQTLLFFLLPAIIAEFFVAEFLYHHWLGQLDKYSWPRRAGLAVALGAITFLLIFVLTALIYGGLAANLQQQLSAINQPEDTAIIQQVIGAVSETNNTYLQSLLNETLAQYPHRPLDFPSRGAITGDFLLFNDLSVYSEAWGENTADDVVRSIAIKQTMAPYLTTLHQQDYYRRRGWYYDNTTTINEHLKELDAGLARIRAALPPAPAQATSSFGETSIFGLCGESPMTMLDAAMCRFARASRTVGALRQTMIQLGIRVATLRGSQEATYKIMSGDSLDVQLLKKETEFTYLLYSRRLESRNDINAFAEQHWQDPYIGPTICRFLPASDMNGDENSPCVMEWALAYDERGLCDYALKNTISSACRAAVAAEENRVYNVTGNVTAGS